MSGGDLLGALPDHVLLHVLSFLPSHEAVRASVLSRRWRHLWRSTPALRVAGFDPGHAHGRDDAFAMFVNRFLLLRDAASPLRSFEIDLSLVGEPGDDYDDGYGNDGETSTLLDQHLDLWIRHAAPTCRELALCAVVFTREQMPRLAAALPIASGHLTTVHLQSVKLRRGFLDFSHCPALLHLSLHGCYLNGDAVVSPSLERLTVTRCEFMCGPVTDGKTTMISTQRLRWLHMSDYSARTHPCLQRMPSLTTATVRLFGGRRESHGRHCLLLHGLSEATSLELIAMSSHGQAILQRDLKWCPIFNKLKTLILNEWCVYDDEIALPCLLRNSPILEKLILEFFESHGLQSKANRSCIISEQKSTFEHLKTVEIKCGANVISSTAFKVLKVLSSCGVPLSKISIQGTITHSETPKRVIRRSKPASVKGDIYKGALKFVEDKQALEGMNTRLCLIKS